jgi:hypothetical protein
LILDFDPEKVLAEPTGNGHRLRGIIAISMFDGVYQGFFNGQLNGENIPLRPPTVMQLTGDFRKQLTCLAEDTRQYPMMLPDPKRIPR